MIIKQFEEQIERFAEKTAVITESRTLTYNQLNQSANRVAHEMIERTGQTGKKGGQQIIALLFEHSVDMIVGVLATLKSGNVYVPLDINYPEKRLSYMLEHSGASLLLTNRSNFPFAKKLAGYSAKDLLLINVDEISGDAPDNNLNIEIESHKPAYILYTSGSTGKPKGVYQSHKNVLYYIRNWTKKFSITPDDRMTLFSAFSHDGAGQDMFGALLNGATLYPFNILGRSNIAGLAQWLSKEKITIWHSVPTLYRYFVNTLGKDKNISLPDLRYVLLGGEQIRDHDITVFQNNFPHAILANVYGQTESSVNSIWSVGPNEQVKRMLIGDPCNETEILIVDDQDEILEEMGVGEIVISSQFLALGYWQDPKNTEAVFSDDPDLGRLYFTGDLGRLLKDGSIEILGRKDSQVKIRGFRVEVGEIETALLSHPAVKEIVVMPRTDDGGNVMLCAYLVAKPGEKETINITELRDYLSRDLPEYMIPSRIMTLDSLPQTPNGKVDRKRLPEPKMLRPEMKVHYVSPKSGFENDLSGIWKEVLGLDKVGVDDNFFDLGGTSLHILTIMRRIFEIFKINVPVVAIFRYPTIRSFIGFLEGEMKPGDPVFQTKSETKLKSPMKISSGDDFPPIAVIGLAGRFPGGRNVTEFWQNLTEGIESIAFMSDQELEQRGIDSEIANVPGYVKAGGFLEGTDCFDASFFRYSPVEAQVMDPQLRILHECAWHALEDAGYIPDSCEETIGLYAGNAPNQYWVALTYLNQVRGPDTVFLNNNYSTKISYKLNLMGPSFIVQTACSTSLVAVHLACRGIMAGECDMALAGGVSISFPDRRGYQYKAGMILSPDGHCRAFDDAAGGTVFGNGVGIVVLKALDKAIANGDQILAVIKGSAINNDGSRKVGISAPSVEGQAEVICAAQQAAGVKPETISYIEAHGTGTIMGDPIEIEALKLAFNTEKKSYCAMGSVKTNVGHLNTASGIAGFIKVVLALKHKLIPPILHFEKSNSAIDFENCPFFVNTRLLDWKNGDLPLRAGISSFGIGGTNAHVVLEEAPVINRDQSIESVSGDFSHAQLIALSARTPQALDEMSANLAARLDRCREEDIADIAYTLKTGRKVFKYRKVFLAETIDEAIDKLQPLEKRGQNGKASIYTGRAVDGKLSVIFMFSGQGTQYRDMGLGLYMSFQIFRDEMDRCFDILKPLTNFKLKDIIYPSLGKPEKASGDYNLKQTEIAQLAIFSVEYALAKLLMAWGIQPRAMIGHSIGEYVAACLSGVFSLEDGLALVALRGKLMQKMPGGSMLSVPMREEELIPLMFPDMDLAAVNAPSYCVVSGKDEVITNFAARLKELGHESRILRTSHGFHSSMMEPVMAEFTEKVKSFTLNQPRIPYISNVSGQWISMEDIGNPSYWASHLRNEVRFNEGIKELIKEESPVFLEVGPGRSLCTFVKQQGNEDYQPKIFNFIRHPEENVSDADFMLQRLGMYWLIGGNIDWSLFYKDKHGRKVSLPGYPFEHQVFKLEKEIFKLDNNLSTEVVQGQKDNPIEDWFYVPSWELAPIDEKESKKIEPDFWLVFGNDSSLSATILKELRRKKANIILVEAGSVFSCVQEDVFTINPARDEDYAQLFNEMPIVKGTTLKVIHLWSVPREPEKDAPTLEGEFSSYQEILDLGFHSLVALARDLGKRDNGSRTQISIITSSLHAVTGLETPSPIRATVLGPIQVISREFPQIVCSNIDVDPGDFSGNNALERVRELISEATFETLDNFVAYREGLRYKRDFIPKPLVKPEFGVPGVYEKGVYLITGGLGGIGLEIASSLTRVKGVCLVLVGRTPFPPRDEWLSLTNRKGIEDETIFRINRILEMEAKGAQVMVTHADISDMDQVQIVIDGALERFGKINGVLHGAGIADGRLIQLRDREMSEKVMAPKVRGALVLDHLLRDHALDFFILFSSISSFTAPMGQAAYCAANIYLDTFARFRSAHKEGLTISINWDAWKQVGMAARAVQTAPSSREEYFQHPIFRKKRTYQNGDQVFIAHLDEKNCWFLSEHKLLGMATMPGTAYLEISRAALAMVTQKESMELRNVYFLSPMILKENETREIHTLVSQKGSGFNFTIFSLVNGTENQWVEHARGEAAILEKQDPEMIDHDNVAARLGKEEKLFEFEDRAPRSGSIEFGPRWHSLISANLSNGEGLGVLALPTEFKSDKELFSIHPALLDVATTLLRRDDKIKGSYLPFFYKRISITGNMGRKIYSYVRHLEKGSSRENEILKYNISILDEGGREIISIEEFTLKKVPSRQSGSNSLTRDIENVALEIDSPGTFDNLVFRPKPRQAPGPGQVEIEVIASGLNFKEVLRALGALGSVKEGFQFGLECAGKITAVGAGVENFIPGDEVVAMGTSCFSRYVTTAANMTAKKPAFINFQEAASIPIAYLTAYYALVKWAGLRRGQRVLIHSAAGGVGLAAVNIARFLGAEIFATAGNEEKRAYLRGLGIQHVMDSRSLDFAQEVMKITENRGVDLVLNSLAGEFIAKSLSLLAPFGRFVEIGIRDIMNNSNLGLRPFLKGLSYFAFQLSLELPGIEETLSELMDRFHAGDLSPLPIRIFAADDIAQAFEYMTRGIHMGKIVVVPGDQGQLSLAKASPKQTGQPYSSFLSGKESIKVEEGSKGKLEGDILKNAILPAQGVEAFLRILGSEGLNQVVVCTQNLHRRTGLKRGGHPGLATSGQQGKMEARAGHLRPELSTPYVAPESETEIILARVWQELLGFSSIGIHDDFFELGGDSLKAITFAGRIHRETDVEVSLPTFFNHPTIKELASFIIGKSGDSKYHALEPVEKREYYPTTSAQARLFILQQLEQESTGYNLPTILLIDGKLDKIKLEEAVKDMVSRHESLRTSFEMIDGQAVQRIHDSLEFRIENLIEGDLEPEVLMRRFVRSFDLSKAPLIRVGLITLSDKKHLLVWDIHHIVYDGTSTLIFFRELWDFYKGIRPNSLEIQYKDYSLWQTLPENRSVREKQEKYWLGLYEDEIPVINLPYDFPRPPIQSFAGKRIDFSMGETETNLIKEIANREESTIYMTLLGLFYILLTKLSGQEDIIVGTPTAGRRVSDLEIIIGMFVNTLALRNFPKGDLTFKELLASLKTRTLQAFENQDYPFEDLVEKAGVKRDASRNPLFDVMFRLHNFELAPRSEKETGLKDLKLGFFKFDPKTAIVDLNLTAMESSNTLRFTFEYCTALFKVQTIERFIAYFNKLMVDIEKNLDVKIADIEIISQKEKKQLLDDFNDTGSRYARTKTIPKLFAQQVERGPDRIVLVETNLLGKNLTYSQLDLRSDSLATTLKKHGLGPNSIVGLLLSPNIEMLTGMLAILKTGAAYLPLDPNFPVERLNYILEKSDSEFLIKQGDSHNLCDLCFDGPVLDIDDKSNFPTLKTEFKDATGSQHPAYVIFTSGSTGNPKGVVIEHRNIHNFISGMTALINFSPGKTIMALTTISFDIFVLETLLPMVLGMKILVAHEECRQDPHLLGGAIVRHRVDMLQLTPSRLQLLLAGDQNLVSLKWVGTLMIGGEAFPENLFLSLKTQFKGQIFNMYGPTETTVWSAMKNLSESNGVNIGNPIANTQVYIVDRYGKTQPLGVAGELLIAGEGLSRGYLNNPQLTGEKFQNCCYRTGDLARWSPQGELEFLGRLDFQVKIRGFRIELDEIEEQLLKHPLVETAVVLARSDNRGELYLCAYYILLKDDKGDPAPGEIRGFLAVKLPEYMIPTYFMALDAMPLTPNGKINRNALPEPSGQAGLETEYVAPRDWLDAKLVELWNQVLEIPNQGANSGSISITANFFEIGGHSLRAIMLISFIHKELNVKIPLGQVFKNPTIQSLSAYIKNAATDQFESIPAVEKLEYYPQSSGQKRLYVLNQLDNRSLGYNLPTIVSLDGDIRRSEVERTIKALIQRHEILRTSFDMIAGNPIQIIHNSVHFSLEYNDLSGIASENQDLSRRIKDFIRPFSLRRPPLLRAGLVKIQEKQYLLMLDIHHIIYDGSSSVIFLKEFSAIYQHKTLSPHGIQYKDFALWQQKTGRFLELKGHEEFWSRELDGELPVLNLPADFPRPAMQSHEGGVIRFDLSHEETRVLKEFALARGATLFMVLLGLYNVMLARLSNQEDILVGSPVAGRRHPDVNPLIGLFLNTMVLRNLPVRGKTFHNFIEEVKERTLKSFEHQDYPFEDLVEILNVKRDLTRNPLFDAMLILHTELQQGAKPGKGEPSVKIEAHEYEKTISQFDITFSAFDMGDHLVFNAEYTSAIYKKESVTGFIDCFKNIVSAVIKNPDLEIWKINIISNKDKEKIIKEFNDTQVSYARNRRIPQLFSDQALATPHAVALIGTWRGVSNCRMSYRELDERSNCLARVLLEEGARSGGIIGLMVERTLNMMVGLLGILKIGAAYLPMGPEYPEERIKYMLEHSEADMLLTDISAGPMAAGTRILDLDRMALSGAKPAPLDLELSPLDVAYVIYTSGTTGRPKGVMIEHRAVSNFIKGMVDLIKVGADDRIYSLTTLAFDIFGLETIFPLTRGAAVVIGTASAQLNAQEAAEIIIKEKISVFQATPSRVQLILLQKEAAKKLRRLKYLLVGGEAFPQEILDKARNYTTGKILNMYGPTETTIWSAVKDVSGRNDLNIGKPIANTRIYIISPEGLLQPVGIPGELCIAGDGLARGYLNNSLLTREKFVEGVEAIGERFYKTGDLARWLGNGELDFLGRIDHQVKIRGFRIELGEIEHYLKEHDHISDTVVIALEDNNKNKYLCAYLVCIPESENVLDTTELREFLSTKLPDYMLPASFVKIREIPLNKNGKIDRKALETYQGERLGTGTKFVPPGTESEKKVAVLWREILNLEQVGIHENFFEIGGNSLNVIRLNNRIKEEWGRDIPVALMFRHLTISAFARHLKELEIEDPSTRAGEQHLESLDKAKKNLQKYT